MLIHKFDYQNNQLERIDSETGRMYRTTEGAVPSVTTILEACKDDDTKESLKEWRDWIGKDQANVIVKNSADIGTLLHKHLECHVKGEERPGGTNMIRKIARTLADSIIDNGFKHVSEVWGVEVPLYYSGLYAGTTDAIAVHKGSAAILDYKNARRIRTDDQVKYYKLQTVAYAEAHNNLYGTDIKKTIIMMACRDDRNDKDNYGKYQEWIIEGKEYERVSEEWYDMLETYYSTRHIL